MVDGIVTRATRVACLLLLASLLSACEEADLQPPPDPSAAPQVEAEPEPNPVPLGRTTDLGLTNGPYRVAADLCSRSAPGTPEAAWQGHGQAWTATLGPSTRDFPGPGATIGPGGSSFPPTIQLLGKLGPDEGSPVCASAEAELGVASRIVLRPGRSLAAGDRPPTQIPGGELLLCDDGNTEGDCFALLQGHLDRGVLLPVLELDDALLGLAARPAVAERLRAELARIHCNMRVFAADEGVLSNLAVALPSTAPLLAARLFDVADLIVLRDAGPLEPVALEALSALLRSRGARIALAPSLLAAPGAFEAALVSGATLWLDGSGLSPEQAAAARWLRAHPERLHLGTARTAVALLRAQGAPLSEEQWRDALRAVGELRASSVELRLLDLRPSAFAVPRELNDRLARFDQLVLTSPSSWTPNELALLAKTGSEVTNAAFEPLSPARAAAPPRPGGARRAWLPKGVSVRGAEPGSWRRFVDPSSNSVLYHRVGGGEASLELPPFRSASPGACSVALEHPALGTTEPLVCTAGPEGLATVTVPADPGWQVVRHGVESGAIQHGSTPIQIRPPAGATGFSEVQLLVPGWPEGETLSLSFPEMLGGGVAGLWDQLEPTYKLDSGDERMSVEASNEQVRVRGALVGRPGSVEVELSLTNLGPSPLPDVFALLCLSTAPSAPFAESGHERTWFVDDLGLRSLDELSPDSGSPLYVEASRFALPITLHTALDGGTTLGHAFEASDVVGGNAGSNGVCIHSRPQFGTLAPGQTVTRRGRLWVGGSTPEEILASYRAAPLEPQERALGSSADRLRYPCAP